METSSKQAGASGTYAAPAAATASAAGAPPSITAPANCIRPLRHGVDSLYVSYAGQISEAVALCLQEFKELAQSPKELDVIDAVCHTGDHAFTVLPRGRGRFAFVLEDNWFSIQLSNASASVLPLAHVQIRSEYLTAVGPEEALRTLDDLITYFGDVAGPAVISRIDLFVDFVGDHDLTAEPGFAWVKRCKKRDIHEENNRVTGISFGPGNEISARLYDKTLEILKSSKLYMRPLWAMNGWQGDSETVWRMEFQTRREGLPEALKGSAYAALPNLGAWWRYLATEWLRLALPSDSDETRSRWPTHPVWQNLADVWESPDDAPPMTRVTKARAPTDDAIFKSGLWGLTSFMAREGITELDDGIGEFLHALGTYFDASDKDLTNLRAYLARKSLLKARRYNTARPTHEKD
ncbi:MAG TPA: hypothetical protein VF730_03835 [Terracidiphilus sp.]